MKSLLILITTLTFGATAQPFNASGKTQHKEKGSKEVGQKTSNNNVKEIKNGKTDHHKNLSVSKEIKGSTEDDQESLYVNFNGTERSKEVSQNSTKAVGQKISNKNFKEIKVSKTDPQKNLSNNKEIKITKAVPQKNLPNTKETKITKIVPQKNLSNNKETKITKIVPQKNLPNTKETKITKIVPQKNLPNTKEIAISKIVPQKNLSNTKDIIGKTTTLHPNHIALEEFEDVFSPKFSLNPTFEKSFQDINDGIYNLQGLLINSTANTHKDWGSELEDLRQDFFQVHELISDFVSRKAREFILDSKITQVATDWHSFSQNELSNDRVTFKSLTSIAVFVDQKRNQWIDDLRHNDELSNLVTHYSRINSDLCNDLNEFLYWAPKIQVPIDIAEGAQNILSIASKNLITSFEDVITFKTNYNDQQTAASLNHENENQAVVGAAIPQIFIGPKIVPTFVTISDGAYNLQRTLNESQDNRLLTWGKTIKLAQEEQYGTFRNLYELLSAQLKLFSENHEIQLRIHILSLCIDSHTVGTLAECVNTFKSHHLLEHDFQEKELRETASHFFGFKADPRDKIHSLLVQDIKTKALNVIREIRSRPELIAAFHQYYTASNRLWNLLIEFVAAAEQMSVSPNIVEDAKNFMNKITPVTLDIGDLFTDQGPEVQPNIPFQKPSPAEGSPTESNTKVTSGP